MTPRHVPWAPPDGRFIDMPTGACFYREAGVGLPPIVLWHGLPVDARVYGRLQPLLSRRYRTLAPDFFGWGFSRPNEGLRYGFTTLDRNVAQFMEALALRASVVVAHEMAGPPVLRWAATHADQLRGLILLNTYFGRSSAHMPEALRLLNAPYIGASIRRMVDFGRSGLSWQLYRWQVGRLWVHRQPDSERILRTFHAMFRHSREGRRAFHAISDELVEQIGANQRQLEVLAAVRCPTLLLWGADDPYLNTAAARHLHRLLPGSELRLLPRAGHFPQLEAPEAVATAVEEFVDRTAGARPDPRA
ncbi:MAG: alpha/beta hydrolase [Actinobacteria bacterium]|nr:alpha/beta hydrolase [Actinomycetota bacterium]